MFSQLYHCCFLILGLILAISNWTKIVTSKPESGIDAIWTIIVVLIGFYTAVNHLNAILNLVQGISVSTGVIRF